MFARLKSRKDRNAFQDGQTAYAELAHYGLFEGPAYYTRSLRLSMMETTNPYQPGTPQHAEWEAGWRERAGRGRADTASTGPK